MKDLILCCSAYSTNLILFIQPYFIPVYMHVANPSPGKYSLSTYQTSKLFSILNERFNRGFSKPRFGFYLAGYDEFVNEAWAKCSDMDDFKRQTRVSGKDSTKQNKNIDILDVFICDTINLGIIGSATFPYKTQTSMRNNDGIGKF